MSQAQRIQFEQQYNDALNGDKAENKIPDQPFSKIKDSREWTKGSEPMTAAQRSYLLTLMELHGENLDENLTKAQAAELIDHKMQNITIPPAGEEGNDFWQSLKNLENWSTGEEPATFFQLSYLKTLADEPGDIVGEKLSKAEASKQIEALQGKAALGK